MKELQRVIICEDHPIFAQGIEFDLQDHFNIVANVNSGKDLFHFLKHNSADFLLLDLNLVDSNGVEVVEQLKELNISIKIIVISMYNDKMLIEKCKKLGVHAYCSKHIIRNELLDILDSVKDGEFLIDKAIRNRYKIRFDDPKRNETNFEKKLKLTKRELEVMELLSRGLSKEEVADKLSVAVSTIEVHQKKIYKKLKINSIAQMIAFYYENL